jgi:hypothetical protein
VVTCPNGHASSAVPADSQRSFSQDNRVFNDTLSRQWGFHPAEVKEVGAMLGSRAANCISANGDVNFSDRSEERHFRERYRAVRADNEARVRSCPPQAEHGDE